MDRWAWFDWLSFFRRRGCAGHLNTVDATATFGWAADKKCLQCRFSIAG